jgi:hypothetical protein
MTTTSFGRRGSEPLWLVATIATTAACANLDHEVVPDVVRAAVAVDRNAPDELATVDVSLRLTAGSAAEHTIEIWDVWLMKPAHTVSSDYLRLAFTCSGQSRFEACAEGILDIDPDQQLLVKLANVGTTNADLIPLCQQAVDLYLNIRYLDDPTSGFADVEPPRVTIACN